MCVVCVRVSKRKYLHFLRPGVILKWPPCSKLERDKYKPQMMNVWLLKVCN